MMGLWTAMTACLFVTSCISVQGQSDLYREVTYSVLEEEDPGRLVGNLIFDTRINLKYSSEVLKKLEYSLPQEDPFAPMFYVDAGVLYTKVRIDRDVLCPKEIDCTRVFSVTVGPPQYFMIIQVTINILDINDNVPYFSSSNVSVSLSEASSIGTSVKLPAALDKDSPSYGPSEYYLASKSEVFGLRFSQRDAGGAAYLVLKKALNREQQNTYTVTLGVRDGGTPPKSNSTLVTIEVLDVNDHSPVFKEKFYQVALPEESKALVPLVQVQATDADLGENGRIVYDFDQDIPQDIRGKFSIDEESGWLYASVSLDREEKEKYEFQVVARDNGPNSLPAQADVTVVVTDINDHAPTVTVGGGKGRVLSVSEGAKVGDFAGHITIQDLDSGANGRFHCEAISDKFNMFHIHKGNYRLVVKETSDRETDPTHNVTVSCSDKGAPPKNSTATIHVQIADENDNKPQFAKDLYEVSLFENNNAGQQVLQVTASDGDIGQNAEITYTLSEKVRGTFDINPRTGLIRANKRLDYEREQTIQLTVTARDGGDPQLSATATAIINIINVNDETPLFSQTEYHFSVRENAPPGTRVGNVTAEDKDIKMNDKHLLYYFERNGWSAALPFKIDSKNGNIKTTDVIDYEKQSKYVFKVYVSDQGNPPLNSSAIITVNVQDMNDNPPRVIFPPSPVYQLNLTSFSTVRPVMQFRATDADSPAFSRHTFSITNPHPLFRIDRLNGKLYITRLLDYSETNTSYKLNVTVNDAADAAMFVQRQVTINLLLTEADTTDSEPYSLILGPNITVVIVVLSISAVLTVLLTVAILLVLSRRRRQRFIKYQRDGGSQEKAYHMTIAADDTVYTGEAELVSSDKKAPMAQRDSHGFPVNCPSHNKQSKVVSHFQVHDWLQGVKKEVDGASETSGESGSTPDSGRGTVDDMRHNVSDDSCKSSDSSPIKSTDGDRHFRDGGQPVSQMAYTGSSHRQSESAQRKTGEEEDPLIVYRNSIGAFPRNSESRLSRAPPPKPARMTSLPVINVDQVTNRSSLKRKRDVPRRNDDHGSSFRLPSSGADPQKKSVHFSDNLPISTSQARDFSTHIPLTQAHPKVRAYWSGKDNAGYRQPRPQSSSDCLSGSIRLSDARDIGNSVVV